MTTPSISPQDEVLGARDSLAASTLAEAIADANIPTLLMVLVQLTGEDTWLTDRYRPSRSRGLGDDDTGGLPEAMQAEIRVAATDVLLTHLADGCSAPEIPDPEQILEMFRFSVAEPVPEEYGHMMAKDLENQLHSTMSSTPATGNGPAPPPGHDLSVLIVGAGPSGLLTAIKLQEAGIPYTLVDRNLDAGGTWLANEYPGAAVDTPSDIYSFSFAPYEWNRYFSQGGQLREYLQSLADRYDIRAHARFGSDAKTARWDDASQMWHLTVEQRDGSQEVLIARILISAVGVLSRPQIPSIPGLQKFVGPTFHTARWPRGFDISGKRIAVIGTGATAMQLVPAIVDDAEHVTVLQRTAQWAAPFEKFRAEIPPALRELLIGVPLYRAWYRLRQAWIFNDKVYDSLIRDPDWPNQDVSINAVNDAHRQFFTRYIVSELGERDDLRDKVIPTYPPFLKRMLLDNGWFAAMKRDDVTLETGRIREITADRVIMESGVEHEVDVLVLATGFDATHFLASLDVRGRDDVSLSEIWQGDNAKAYLGMAVPGFPNFFTLSGPNLQTGHGGSLMYIAECELQYLMDLMSQMGAGDITSVECKETTHAEYNQAVDAQHDRMIWSHHGASTYYRNSHGRVVVNSPWRVVDYWRMTQHADLSDYVTETRV